jgi:hypothetical protein
MTPPSSDPLRSIRDYPLFAALFGRRSRRFGRGFAITEGPFRHASAHPPQPLGEIEEALLVGAGIGASGAPLWDGARPPTGMRAGDGRTFPSTTRGHRTALFFTNDAGVHVIDPRGVAATRRREVEAADDHARILAAYREHRRTLEPGRLAIPRQVPPLFAHNFWDSSGPGSTLFMPVCDVSLSLILLISQLVDRVGGRFVGGQPGGFLIVDDRHGMRPAGTEPWRRSGFLDETKALPLSVLERQACYFMFSEPAHICHNIFLATEAIGLGGWMHCGFLSAEILRALGFRTVDPTGTPVLANPVGRDGVFEGYCPPYYRDMDAAVDAALADMAAPSPSGAAPHRMADTEHDGALLRLSDDGIACTKAVCRYIHDTYGRFPGAVDTMHLMWFMQVHHLDLDFYDRFFHADAYGARHAGHQARWHP